MNDIHKMSLFPEPFEMIKNGQKTIELRINDKKRQKIKIDDYIVFVNTETGEKIMTEVTNLYRFQSFRELYQALPLLKCGYTKANIDNAKPEDMDMYYSPERQKYYGVLGMEIRII